MSFLNKIMFEKQISRFIFIGILNVITSFAVYFILLYLNIFYIFALLISQIIAVIQSFILNKKWTFKSKGNGKIEGLRFISVYGVTFLINILLLALFVEILNLNPKIGQVFAFCIVAIMNFIGHKYWSFR